MTDRLVEKKYSVVLFICRPMRMVERASMHLLIKDDCLKPTLVQGSMMPV